MLNQIMLYTPAITSYMEAYCEPGTIRTIRRKDNTTIIISIECETCPYDLVLQKTNNTDVVRINDALYIYESGWKYLCRV